MIPSIIETSAQISTTGHTIHPGHGVLKSAVLFRQGEESVEIIKSDSFNVQVGGLYLLQAKFRPRDEASESEPTDRGFKIIGVFCRRTEESPVVRSQQFELRHVTSERPGVVMILTVDVIRNSTTYRDEFCSGGGRQEPSPWDYDSQNFLQRHSCFTTNDSFFFIEPQKAVQSGCRDHASPLIQATVSVTPPQSER